MSTSLIDDNNNENTDTKSNTISNSNNCSSVNENDVVIEVIVPPPELQPSRKKRKNTSMVWYNFTKCSEYSDDDSHDNFNYCNVVYACHLRRNRNSTMRTHLDHYYKKNPYQLKDNKVDITQTKLVFLNKDNDGDSKKNNYKIFTIENAWRQIALMIIIDELSFRFMENEIFRKFIEGTLMLVEPSFIIHSRTTIAIDILEKIC